MQLAYECLRDIGPTPSNRYRFEECCSRTHSDALDALKCGGSGSYDIAVVAENYDDTSSRVDRARLALLLRAMLRGVVTERVAICGYVTPMRNGKPPPLTTVEPGEIVERPRRFCALWEQAPRHGSGAPPDDDLSDYVTPQTRFIDP